MKQKKSLPRKAFKVISDTVIKGVCIVAGVGLVVAFYTAPLWARHPKNKP